MPPSTASDTPMSPSPSSFSPSLLILLLPARDGPCPVALPSAADRSAARQESQESLGP
eukprot:CAMPEP_0177593728 /NCGR_PEP_ID=MMETSP0419_2-20121207/9343_1 /TAXON_ID=582737 /ORGANISM="Tetraselmis sp., Strain GSL018" /LENGTH=57 /DNA_ID=CAMNT_0019084871 /DNA_START=86 /DNA_END=259 /DNA_ORIENTATION=-